LDYHHFFEQDENRIIEVNNLKINFCFLIVLFLIFSKIAGNVWLLGDVAG